MPWNVALVMTSAGGGSPLAGIPVIEAGPQGTRLATTDESGAATVTLDVDTSVPSALSALYVSAARFSIQGNAVTVYDQEACARVTSGLPPYAGEPAAWARVQYAITDSGDGSPVTGIPVIDPLTGTVLASDLEFTISSWSTRVTVLGSSPIIPSPPTISFLE